MKKNIRRCAQCRSLKSRQLLMQIKHTAAGFAFVSPETFLAGRSIYLCPEPNCWQKAARNKGILRGSHRPHREHWQVFCATQQKQIDF